MRDDGHFSFCCERTNLLKKIGSRRCSLRAIVVDITVHYPSCIEQLRYGKAPIIRYRFERLDGSVRNQSIHRIDESAIDTHRTRSSDNVTNFRMNGISSMSGRVKKKSIHACVVRRLPQFLRCVIESATLDTGKEKDARIAGRNRG